MKIDLNFNLLDLDSNEIDGANAGKLLAQALIGQTKGDSLKFWELALKLNKGEIIDLDSSDQTMIKEFVKNSETMTVLAKGQILKAFNKD